MLFSSPLFLFVFLPVLLGLYAVAGPRNRNLVLLAASLLFYIWGEGAYVLVMIAIIAVNYGLGRRVEMLEGTRPRKITVAVAVVVEPGLAHRIQVLKFSGRSAQRLARQCFDVRTSKLAPVHLPLGISFFTFHAISYVVDISPAQDTRRQAARLRSLHDAFPAFDRRADCSLRRHRRADRTPGGHDGGVCRGDPAVHHRAGQEDAGGQHRRGHGRCHLRRPGRELNFSLAWLGVACYTLQIYFDFSGYSDMAIGLAKLFGIDFLENFNYPYAARSVTEFWRRWHISLSSWFRDYLYIPLGGNRCGRVRNYFNLVIVFFLCGLWHGASWTFAAWGLFHGAFLVLERMKAGRVIDSLWSPVRHLYTLLVVSTGWVLFRADTVPQAEAFLKAMAGLGTWHGPRVSTSVSTSTRNWSWL